MVVRRGSWVVGRGQWVQFNGKDYLQTHGTAMGTKMAVALANIFMAKIEKEILRQSDTKPIFWKRFIDDVISMWNIRRDKIEDFLLEANSFHPTIKSRLKSQKPKLHSWTRKCTKVLDSIRNLFLTCERISKLPRPSSTRISIRVTHQALRKALSKEKR